MKKNEEQLIQIVQENPMSVKVEGNRQAITLICGEIKVRFPVRDYVYTRFVCSLDEAEVLNPELLEGELTSMGIKALAEAVLKRPVSSYDLSFS